MQARGLNALFLSYILDHRNLEVVSGTSLKQNDTLRADPRLKHEAWAVLPKAEGPPFS